MAAPARFVHQTRTSGPLPQDGSVGLAEQLFAYLPQHFINFGVGAFDRMSGQALVKAGSTQPTEFIGPLGRASVFGDASGVNYYELTLRGSSTAPVNRQNCSIVWVGQATGDGVIVRDFSAASGCIPIWKNAGAYDLRWADTDFAAAGTWTNNVDQCIVLTATPSGANAAVELWVNGILRISGTATGTGNPLVSWTLHRNGNASQGVSARCYAFGTFAKGFPSALARDISANPRLLFDDQRIWVPASSGSTAKTATTSLGGAIQVAQTATATVAAAIQISRTSTADITAAIQIARTAQASIDGAIQAAGGATASVDAYVQAGSSASTSLNAAIQRTVAATASLEAAVQANASATASVNAYIQAGTIASASISAAIQVTVLASANLSAAIASARSASASLGAAIALQLTIGAAMTAAVQARFVASTTLGAYVFDPSGGVTRYPSRNRTFTTQRLARSIKSDRIPRSITP